MALAKPKSQICSLREQLGLTQSELAKRWGVSVVTVRSWEKDPAKAHHLVMLILLCHLLDCLPKDLVGYSPFPNSKSKLAQLRESNGFTQKQVAEALQISVITVQNWESRRTSSRQFEQFNKLCKILECNTKNSLDKLIDSIQIEAYPIFNKLIKSRCNQELISEEEIKKEREEVQISIF